MPKLPILSGKKLLKLLVAHHFIEVRQKGSHVFIQNPKSNLRTVIPVHGREELGKGLLRKILNDLDLTAEELLAWLKK